MEHHQQRSGTTCLPIRLFLSYGPARGSHGQRLLPHQEAETEHPRTLQRPWNLLVRSWLQLACVRRFRDWLWTMYAWICEKHSADYRCWRRLAGETNHTLRLNIRIAC